MKLYRFRYSPFARKVQMVLDLVGATYEAIEVPYSQRTELATLTGGYIYVPVLALDSGEVLVQSRAICERLVTPAPNENEHWLVPAPLQGPIWGYADFADNVLEDILFKVGSPAVRSSWTDPGERALYVLVKERKFGAGCVDTWLREQGTLVADARRLLAPTVKTLERGPFLFGDTPTLADAALYGQAIMLEEAEAGLLDRVAPLLTAFARRLEGWSRARGERAAR